MHRPEVLYSFEKKAGQLFEYLFDLESEFDPEFESESESEWSAESVFDSGFEFECIAESDWLRRLL